MGPAASGPPPEARRAFLDERRRESAERLNLAAPTYDRDWGAIAPSHARFVHRLLERTRPHGTVLDAACGTGKYWPAVLASGRTVIGVDHADGMLAAAAASHPEVPTGRLALHEIAFDALFDAVLCVDAMEYVGPEDWPAVLAALRRAARPGAHLYVTVELPDTEQVRHDYERAVAAGEQVVPGESIYPAGYHFYPTADAVDRWVEGASLEVIDDQEADEYRHLLLRRPTAL